MTVSGIRCSVLREADQLPDQSQTAFDVLEKTSNMGCIDGSYLAVRTK